MKYKNKNIKNLSEWALVQYIISNPKVTNVHMSKQFNISKSTTHYVLKKLLSKKVIKSIRSKEKNKGKEVLYYINKDK